jgi:hypothetical protein
MMRRWGWRCLYIVNLSGQYKLQRPHEDSSMDKASPSLNSRNEHFALLSALVIIKEESGLRCVALRRVPKEKF